MKRLRLILRFKKKNVVNTNFVCSFCPATNAGMIAGVTFGCIVAVILIVIFLIFMWTRRKDTEEDLANDIKYDDYH